MKLSSSVLKTAALTKCFHVFHRLLGNRVVRTGTAAETVGISTGSVKTILHEHLLMTKVRARLVPKMFDQKMKYFQYEVSNKKLSYRLETGRQQCISL